jgi:hypothetical protein
LRLVVNCFQPSVKLQAKVLQGEQVRRVYDVAQTPLQRVLASSVLSDEQQRDVREQVEQIDPLALSEHLDALRYALLCGAHLPPAIAANGRAWPPLCFSLAACTSGSRPTPEEQTGSLEVPGREEILALLLAHPEWTSTQILQEIEHQVSDRAVSAPLETLVSVICPPGYSIWEDPWPPKRLQGGQAEPLPAEPSSSEEVISDVDQCTVQAYLLPALAFGTPGRTVGEHEGGDGIPMTIEQAIVTYLQEMRPSRSPKTLEWHHTSLGALRRYLWRQYRLTDMHHLSRDCLQTWVADCISCHPFGAG